VRALAQLEMTDPGYDLDRLSVLDVGLLNNRSPASGQPSPALEEENADRHRRFFRQLHERIEHVPGAASIALASALPVNDRGGEQPPTFISHDAFVSGSPDLASAFSVGVSPAYFRTLGISLLRGRDFDARDFRGAPPVAVVSATVAARMWPHGDALGKELAAYNPDRPDQPLNWHTVVGIVSDVAPVLQPSTPAPTVYVPLSQQWRPYVSRIVARVDDERAAAVVASVRSAVTSVDAHAVVWRARTMSQLAGELLYPRRTAASILSASGLLGLLLAAVGLYGVVSYSVAQRLREISIRMAIGAAGRDIVGLVLREALVVTAIGGAVGLPLGLAALRTTANLVGPLPSVDVLVLVAVPALMTAVILAACYLPARGASRAHPAEVLRNP